MSASEISMGDVKVVLSVYEISMSAAGIAMSGRKFSRACLKIV